MSSKPDFCAKASRHRQRPKPQFMVLRAFRKRQGCDGSDLSMLSYRNARSGSLDGSSFLRVRPNDGTFPLIDSVISDSKLMEDNAAQQCDTLKSQYGLRNSC